MFRRIAAQPLARGSAMLAAAAASSATLMPQQQQRWCATNNASSAAAPTGNYYNNNNSRNNNNNNNNNRRSGGGGRRTFPLPPAFDIVHWNDDNIAAGHLLRVLHNDTHIVLEYYRQTNKMRDEEGRRVRNDVVTSERVVVVTLPPSYIARFLGVLEGRMAKVDVQSRYTNATFTPISADEHTYKLSCVSTRPAGGQQQDVQNESVTWDVEFDAAESLMLHRFLSQALKYNTGFCHRA